MAGEWTGESDGCAPEFRVCDWGDGGALLDAQPWVPTGAQTPLRDAMLSAEDVVVHVHAGR